MRRSRSPSPSYRALAHHAGGGGKSAKAASASDPMSLVRSFNVETNPARPVRPSPLATSAIRDMPLDLVDRIRSFPLFMSAPEEFLVAIGNHLRPQVHGPQDHILREGDVAKAMYWLVRGVVAVTSRDGEAVYAELRPGAFFGEIGVLMDVPRTATIIARTKCLVVVLKKEDLQAELPRFPDMEKAIRQEAQERLNILRKKRQEGGRPSVDRIGLSSSSASSSSGLRELVPGEVATGEKGAIIKDGGAVNSKKRKSPSPGVNNVIEDPAAGSALGSGLVSIRKTLKELPLFSKLPPDILHFLGLSAVPKTYPPFTNIVCQGSPGNDIYFIVRGEAEVIHDAPPVPADAAAGNGQGGGTGAGRHKTFYQRPRLRKGQYFGEVASLGLSPGRTATVRAITTVECLMIGGEALDELWRRCPREFKEEVEETARRRYSTAGVEQPDDDTEMTDAGPSRSAMSRQSLPHVTFTTPSKPSSPTTMTMADKMEPTDPDPYLSVDMENLRNRRRSSLAPPHSQTMPAIQTDTATAAASTGANGSRSPRGGGSPIRFTMPFLQSPTTEPEIPWKRARIRPQSPRTTSLPLSSDGDRAAKKVARLPDRLVVEVLRHLDVVQLLRIRRVCTHWRDLAATSDSLCKYLDLSPYSKFVSDAVLVNILTPFVSVRPEIIDISNCFHITDEGFAALWRNCGRNVKTWRMRSVWDVGASQILEMSSHVKGLEEIDWSNCRKVGDNLLARVVGWVVPEMPPARPAPAPASSPQNPSTQQVSQQQQDQKPQKETQRAPQMPPPGTVIGCPKLRRLNLSYCKHITDRSMAHLAAHAHSRLESLSLTRCTSITDTGFQAWAPYFFPRLSRLCLADCTYLSDSAVVSLVNAAKNLTHLDLSFCCALTDTSTEVVALGLPKLRELRLSFCGSAVSDGSLGCIALHLNRLEGLSVRGCVRVTGVGMENVLEGCGELRWVDGSQCRNLEGWVRGGGVGRWGFDERGADVGGAGKGQGQGLGKADVEGPTIVPRTFGRGFGRVRRARKPVRFILQKSTGLR
ncbi:related to F-box protein PpaB [Cephalotrichum gorgonifer]|uniref:Related to F-box protein PpaB n=1 Tax=Cephalotrichum gorgonifer TaxID=2041049 RepID=A0AAE8SW38_9PEZI|nr:related to F-box protein PpaB [Cephalotrichum gorgonifer]